VFRNIFVPTPMPRKPIPRAELRQLHYINALFAHATGDDLYLAEQIKSAIAFSLGELEAQTRAHPSLARMYDAAFNAAATELLIKLSRHYPLRGFFHWDAAIGTEAAMPLFTRAQIMAGLKKLAPFREATLLVTNLRPALLPSSRRITPRRQQEYEEALALIRELTAARTTRSMNLQLMFL
jgi:hypothetical protein